MKKYRKKPLVIEAVKWDGEKLEGRYPIEFLASYGVDWHYGHAPNDGNLYELVIHTLEGEITADPGDYIVRGIHGEFYPVKECVFMELYEQSYKE